MVVSSVLAAAAACLVAARWRFRAPPSGRGSSGEWSTDVRLGGPGAPAGLEDPVKELLELKRVCAQSDGGADDLRHAVNAMDQVSKKLLDVIGQCGETLVCSVGMRSLVCSSAAPLARCGDCAPAVLHLCARRSRW